MGLFSAIAQKFKQEKILSTSTAGAVVSTATKVLESALVHPIGTLFNTKKAIEKTASETTGQKVVGAVSNTLLVVAPLSNLGKTAGAKIIEKIAEKPIASATAGVIGAGVLTSSPTATKTLVNVTSSAPENLFKTGETIGGVIEGGKTIKDITSKDVKNVLIGAGAGAVVAGAGALAYDIYKSKKDEAISTNNLNPNDRRTILPIDKPVDYSSIPTSENKPVTPQTTTISTSKRRRKASRINKFSAVNQNVRVIVQQKNTGVSMRKIYKGGILV
jgi:hypothetical protein